MSHDPRYAAAFTAAAAAVVEELLAWRRALVAVPEAAVDADIEAAGNTTAGGLTAVRDLVVGYRARVAGWAPPAVLAGLDRVVAMIDAGGPPADTESAAPAGQNT